MQSKPWFESKSDAESLTSDWSSMIKILSIEHYINHYYQHNALSELSPLPVVCQAHHVIYIIFLLIAQRTHWLAGDDFLHGSDTRYDGYHRADN